MERLPQVNTPPLHALVEKIIEKKSITSDEERQVKAITGSSRSFDFEDFEAISRLTELICSGEVSVERI